MDKKRGGICMCISSKALAITGIDDRRYWNYIPTEESRYGFLLFQSHFVVKVYEFFVFVSH